MIQYHITWNKMNVYDNIIWYNTITYITILNFMIHVWYHIYHNMILFYVIQYPVVGYSWTLLSRSLISPNTMDMSMWVTSPIHFFFMYFSPDISNYQISQSFSRFHWVPDNAVWLYFYNILTNCSLISLKWKFVYIFSQFWILLNSALNCGPILTPRGHHLKTQKFCHFWHSGSCHEKIFLKIHPILMLLNYLPLYKCLALHLN